NLQAQLVQAQKMDSIGRLAGGVAHDFNNMLGVILGHADLALGKTDAASPLLNSLQEIRKAAVRSSDLARQLLAFARKQTIAPKALDLNETVAGMLAMLRRLIGENVELAWQPCPAPARVKMDPSQIDQILANLCVNARDAIGDHGRVAIETGLAAFDEDYCASHAGFVPGDYVMLAVEDNGCGMDAETLLRLFEPFFTTKEIGKGTGLGLATVYGIVKQNNGFIDVDSQVGRGSTFKIYLPRLQIAPPPEPPAAPPPLPTGHETILLAEDDPALLKMTQMMLERIGYHVLPAPSPEEALRLARQNAGRIDLLMTDVVMPGMNGRHLSQTLLADQPGLKRLFMSGYTADVIARHGVLEPGVHFIAKPFTPAELAHKLREILGADSPAAPRA
ncbi:MAG TPA: ATP-binding protein, partial [Kiritimatiellia bacterium]|nr:ATP-binding protein [Kiritimatiellia bacterium]